MAGKNKQEFHCRVVDEPVLIRLVKKSMAGLRSKREFFVQCDQGECQYVDSNALPCPLDLSLFEQEIADREEKAKQNREESSYYG